jgi:hypothetical protein
MPQLVLVPELMKMRFRAFNITLPSPEPSTGRRPGSSSSLSVIQKGGRSIVEVPGLFAGSTKGTSDSTSSGAARPATGVPLPFPPALFRARSNEASDCDYQRAMNDETGKVFETICEALRYSFDIWRSQAYFVGVTINASQAIGGRVEGPSLDTFADAVPGVQALSGWGQELHRGIIGGFSAAWKDYHLSLSVPGLAWYPAFAAFPGAMASPMPNAPTPVFQLTQSSGLLAADSLRNAMRSKARMNTPYQNEVFSAVADELASALTIWRSCQLVTQVVGWGPIPSFSPPMTLVGPVVGGTVNPTPGCFKN